MSFLTYAQNFEDVLLWRALGHVKNGFYIDVGANDPVEHSVTKAFYDAGWWGINIEPMPSYHAVFAAQRPRDINLTVAAGADSGHITLFEVPAMNGWASTDRAVAEAHRADGYDVVETDVPLRRLQDICAEHVRGDIHFLKIDVEGFEEAVLRGMDLRRWRPWVLVVEATLPGQRETNHESWEHLITEHDYHYAYFDGLNRYYVAGEQRALLPLLAVQANVFDDFISYHLDAAWRATREQTQAAQRADAAWRAAEEGRQQADARTDAAHREREQRHEQMRGQLEAVRADADAALRQAQADFVAVAAAQERAHAESRLAQHQLAEQQAAAAAAAGAAREAELHTQLAHSHAALAHQAAVTQALEAWAHNVNGQLLAILHSRAWRWLAPLRALRRLPRLLRPARVAAGLRRAGVAAARRLLRRLSASDRARRLLIPLKKHLPGAAALWLYLSRPPAPPAAAPLPGQAPSAASFPAELSGESAAVRQILADLAAATSLHTR